MKVGFLFCGDLSGLIMIQAKHVDQGKFTLVARTSQTTVTKHTCVFLKISCSKQIWLKSATYVCVGNCTGMSTNLTAERSFFIQ